jgi:hypothetical protein
VDKGGQEETVTATRFAELTGVSRERLRTWERRYGFPRPRRIGSGRRRYYVADAAPVVAVRRAADDGVPLPEAIASARVAVSPRRVPDGLARAVEHLPAPLLLVSGPAPLRVRWVNQAWSSLAPTPAPEGELASAAPWLPGSPLEQALERLFATDARSARCAHPPFGGAPGELVESLLYRVPAGGDGEDELVAIAQLERPAQDGRGDGTELADLRERAGVVEQRLALHDRWMVAVAELAALYQRDSGPALLQATADTIVRRLPPIDAGIGVYMGGELALGSSSRGMLGPRMVTVTAHADLAQVLRERAAAWLSPGSAAAFGADAGAHVLAAPVTVVGETLGAILFVLEERIELDDELRQLLSVLSAAVGFALLRDRLVEAARTP